MPALVVSTSCSLPDALKAKKPEDDLCNVGNFVCNEKGQLEKIDFSNAGAAPKPPAVRWWYAVVHSQHVKWFAMNLVECNGGARGSVRSSSSSSSKP